MSRITPPLALVRNVASPLLNASPFSSQRAREQRPAHEVRQPAQLMEVAAGRDVVVIAEELAVIVRAEMERPAERELIGRQRLLAERGAAAAEREEAAASRRLARSG